jgi:anti-sigma regulatory factor (Ser/Thr protein kinase)
MAPREPSTPNSSSPLAANSLCHTPSGEILIVVASRPGWARVAVTDGGTSEWTRPEASPDAVAEYGRGLFLVEWTADKFGHEVTASGQTMWAEFTWDVEPIVRSETSRKRAEEF